MKWGFDEIVLIVDSQNKPARRLYSKLARALPRALSRRADLPRPAVKQRGCRSDIASSHHDARSSISSPRLWTAHSAPADQRDAVVSSTNALVPQGYKVQGDIQEATVVSVTDDGAVVDEPVENVLMRKSLKVRYRRVLGPVAAGGPHASFPHVQDSRCLAGLPHNSRVVLPCAHRPSWLRHRRRTRKRVTDVLRPLPPVNATRSRSPWARSRTSTSQRSGPPSPRSGCSRASRARTRACSPWVEACVGRWQASDRRTARRRRLPRGERQFLLYGSGGQRSTLRARPCIHRVEVLISRLVRRR